MAYRQDGKNKPVLSPYCSAARTPEMRKNFLRHFRTNGLLLLCSSHAAVPVNRRIKARTLCLYSKRQTTTPCFLPSAIRPVSQVFVGCNPALTGRSFGASTRPSSKFFNFFFPPTPCGQPLSSSTTSCVFSLIPARCCLVHL